MDVVTVMHQGHVTPADDYQWSTAGPIRAGLALSAIRILPLNAISATAYFAWAVVDSPAGDYGVFGAGRQLLPGCVESWIPSPVAGEAPIPTVRFPMSTRGPYWTDLKMYVPIGGSGRYIMCMSAMIVAVQSRVLLEYSFVRESGTRVWSGDRVTGGTGLLQVLQADAKRNGGGR